MAFPLLGTPAGADGAFVHTSFELLGIGFTTLALLGFAALIEPYSLGREADPGEDEMDIAESDQMATAPLPSPPEATGGDGPPSRTP
jgi:hypothetical protein